METSDFLKLLGFITVLIFLAFLGASFEIRTKHETFRLCVKNHAPSECRDILK